MDNKELEEKIAGMDLNSIYNTSPKALKELTNDFCEPLVRSLMMRALTISEQKSLLKFIKNAYSIWQKRLKPLWNEHPMIGGYPEFFDTMEVNIDSDRYITTSGSVPVGSIEYSRLVSQQKESQSSCTYSKDMVDAAIAAVKAQIPHFEYDQQNEGLSIVYGENKGKVNLDEVIEKKTMEVVNKQLEENECTDEDIDEIFADVFGQDLVDQVNKEMAGDSVKNDDEEDAHSDTNSINMEPSVLNRISANNIDNYFEGWRNGKKGAISQTEGIYRFIELTRGKSGMLDRIHHKTEDNPVVAVGIVAYWLIFKQNKDLILQRLTKYTFVPESPKDMFERYTQERFNQFKKENRDNPDAWDWVWEFEFYTKYIVPHEMELNKLSEALFDYISDDDIQLVRSVMNNYIKYLKKVRQEKGYHVSPELLVLRSLADSNDFMLEDLEDFEINAVLDQLESGGYVKVAWIEGHLPEAVRLLDKGRNYLKQLEEGSAVVETASIAKTEPFFTPQQRPKENTVEIPPQTPESSGREEIEEEEWDDTFDFIFDKRIKPMEVKRAIETVKSEKIKDRRFFYVSFRILKVLKWILTETLERDYLRWINLHFECGWENNTNQKKGFLFNLEGTVKRLDDLHPSEWKDDSLYGKLGKHYRLLAISFKNTFTVTIINGKSVDDSESYEHLKDREKFLSGANDVYGLLLAPDEAYINDGK